MKIEVGKAYQSKSHPAIWRGVVYTRKGVIGYRVFNSKYPDHFSPIHQIIESTFIKCSSGEVAEEETKCEE